MSRAAPDVDLTRVLGDAAPPGDPRQQTPVRRLVVAIAGSTGVLLLVQQILQMGDAARRGHLGSAVSALALAATVSVCALVARELASRARLPHFSLIPALVLTLVTALALLAGEDLRLPASSYGPTIFFLLLCVSLETRRRWPLLYFAAYCLLVPALSGYADVRQALAAAGVLAFHGYGVRHLCRALFAQEEAVLQASFQTRRTTAEANAESVALLERQHWDALVHDHVINVLRTAGDTQGTLGPRTRAEAHRALAVISGPAAESGRVRASEVVRRVRAVVEGLAEGTEVGVVEFEPAARVEATVADAMLSAMGEALRNVRRHARAGRVSVTVCVSEGRLAIRVRDDGVGFTLKSVSPTAMGIRGSMVDRMARVGGTTLISSRPGHGTDVLLEWRAPA